MEIQEKVINRDILVIQIKGDLFNPKEVQQLKKTLISHENKHVIIELGEVSYMCSFAVAMMVMGYRQSSGREGKFILCNPQKEVKNILEDMGLFSIFTCCDSEDEAIQLCA